MCRKQTGKKNRRTRVSVRPALLLVIGVIVIMSGCQHSKNTYKPTSGEALPQSPFSAAGLPFPNQANRLTQPLNAVWRLFGGTDKEHSLVYRFGNEPTYFEWMALKLAWTGDRAYVRELKDKIVSFPQTDNGYLWSWSSSTYWPTGKGALHYDGLFRYVAAVDELLRWDASPAFLEERDETTFGSDKAMDASQGRSVYEKCAAAMQYAESTLLGTKGVITLTEQSAFLADGVTRFDRGEDGTPLWNNTGRAESASSNYWDNLCFGNEDAYETMLYYHALLAMKNVETMRGNEPAAKEYERKASSVRAAFNEVFWEASAGRYIACVDADGVRRDPGLTFLNLEALCYGLADEEQARLILDWIDGKRIIPEDTLTGKEILDYTGMLTRFFGTKAANRNYRFAPVSNTVSIESLSPDGRPWWFSLEGAICVGEGQNAAFGRHLENGGYIFYPLFYELSARARYLGANNTAKRLKDLNRVYLFNGFQSDVGTWLEGLNGEFPENGIVSRAFLSDLCGITPTEDALEIHPNLPFGIRSFGVEHVYYANCVSRVEIGKNALSVCGASELSGVIRFFPKKKGSYTVEWISAEGTAQKEQISTDDRGALELQCSRRHAKEIQLYR